MTPRRAAALGGALAAGSWAGWALAGGGYFWPRWVWFAVGVGAAATVAVRQVLHRPPGRSRWLAVDGAALLLLAPTEVVIWLLAGRGFFWPVWSLVGMSLLFGLHIWVVARRPDPREHELRARVDTLTRSRRGALDEQAAELRRIERDLHDGAQARLVSLALNLGLARGLVHTDPETAAGLVEEARLSALSALDDVRTVVQGIQPAVLTDRGLADAVRALGYDLAVPVTITGAPPGGLAPPVESALYFAIAEALANVVKHAGASRASVEYRPVPGGLEVTVGDDGVGGADLRGGTGLRGVVRRLEPFDGVVTVTSPPGGPTRVRIAVPVDVVVPQRRA